MIDQFIFDFTERLIKATKDNKVKWQSLLVYEHLKINYSELNFYLSNSNTKYNQICKDTSYFVQSDEHLLVMLHEKKINDSNNQVDQYSLWLLKDYFSSIDNIGVYNEERLSDLNLTIQNYEETRKDDNLDPRNYLYCFIQD